MGLTRNFFLGKHTVDIHRLPDGSYRRYQRTKERGQPTLPFTDRFSRTYFEKKPSYRIVVRVIRTSSASPTVHTRTSSYTTTTADSGTNVENIDRWRPKNPLTPYTAYINIYYVRFSRLYRVIVFLPRELIIIIINDARGLYIRRIVIYTYGCLLNIVLGGNERQVKIQLSPAIIESPWRVFENATPKSPRK